MPKSYQQSIANFVACDEFCATVNDTHNLIGVDMNSNLS